MEQKIFNQTIARIKYNEVFRANPYKDTKGIWTVGYGWNLKENPLINEHYPMSEKRANELMMGKIKDLLKDLNDYVFFNYLGDVRKGVILEMAYQMGIGYPPGKNYFGTGLLGFDKMIHIINQSILFKIRANDYFELISQEMLNSKWAKIDSPGRAKQLAKIMLTG